MTQDTISAYATAIIALLGPLGVWLWRWVERRDNREDKSSDKRAKQEDSLFNRQDQQLDRAYKRIEELEHSVDQLEQERDRAWQVGWAWYTMCNEMRHGLLECRVNLPSDHPVRIQPTPVLPGFNDVLGKLKPQP